MKRCGDFAGGGVNIGQVGMAIAAPRRRPDSDENGLSISHGLLQVAGEGQPTRLHVGVHQSVEARFVDRDLAAQEGVDLAAVLVYADYIVAKVCKAGSRDKADITGADHGNTHRGYLCNRMAVCARPSEGDRALALYQKRSNFTRE